MGDTCQETPCTTLYNQLHTLSADTSSKTMMDSTSPHNINTATTVEDWLEMDFEDDHQDENVIEEPVSRTPRTPCYKRMSPSGLRALQEVGLITGTEEVRPSSPEWQ